MYWIVFALFSFIEVFADILISWQVASVIFMCSLAKMDHTYSICHNRFAEFGKSLLLRCYTVEWISVFAERSEQLEHCTLTWIVLFVTLFVLKNKWRRRWWCWWWEKERRNVVEKDLQKIGLGLVRYLAGSRCPISDTVGRSCSDTDTGLYKIFCTENAILCEV